MPSTARTEKNLSGQKMGVKGLATRRSVIEATVARLAQTPLRDLKVIDIAEAASVSAATFYLYFDSVIAVVLAAASETTQSTPEILNLLAGPWDARHEGGSAQQLIHMYIEVWDNHRALFRARNLAGEEGDSRFIVARENASRPLLYALAERIDERHHGRKGAPPVQPLALAATLLMMLERLGAVGHFHRERTSRVSYDELVVAATETVNWAMG